MPHQWDVLVENLSNTPDYHVRPVTARDLTSLKRCWPSSLFADMHRHQADMETLRRDCKREFDSELGGGRIGTCPHCGVHAISNLSRHVMDYHLELGQLWRCPVEWCSVWKGTAQDCMDHLCVRHKTDSSVGLKTLWKYFPPWTVTCEAWNAVLHPGVSGIPQTSCSSISMVTG